MWIVKTMENIDISGEGRITELKTYRLKKASEDASVYRLIMMAIKSAFYNNKEYWHEEEDS